MTRARDLANIADKDITGSLTVDSITTSGDIDFADNAKAVFGAGSDLQIYHDGTNSIIEENSGAGSLIIKGTNISFEDGTGIETYATFIKDNAVTLRYDNATKLATTSGGIDVTGTITFDGGTTSADLNFGDNDKASFSSGKLQIYHDGTNAYIDETYVSGTFLIRGNNIALQKYTGETMIQCVSDGKVELNFNNVPKLETTSAGIDVTGTVTADDAAFGTTALAQSALTVGGGQGSLSVNGSDGDFSAGGQRAFMDLASGKARIGGTGGGGAGTTLGLYVGTGTEAMNVTAAGLVGIGKTPSTALDVNGTVTATAFAGDGSGLTGVSSGATLHAWANFNQTGTQTINDSVGISSLTDNGGGTTTLNFSSAMANTTFTATSGHMNGGTKFQFHDSDSASNVKVVNRDVDGGGGEDGDEIATQVAGDAA